MLKSLYTPIDFAAPRESEIKASDTKIEARVLSTDEVGAVAGGWCGTATGIKPNHGITGEPTVDRNPAYVM